MGSLTCWYPKDSLVHQMSPIQRVQCQLDTTKLLKRGIDALQGCSDQSLTAHNACGYTCPPLKEPVEHKGSIWTQEHAGVFVV